MVILENNFKFPIKDNTFIVLGNFDGVHLGHRSLIEKTKALAKENKCKSMVFTFRNHPLSFINYSKSPNLIMDNTQKIQIFKDLSIDIVNFADFDDEMMKTSPENFIKNIIYYYNAKGIVVGYNYKFGYKNKGDIHLLEKLSNIHNFKLYIKMPVKYNDIIVSSSKIREKLKEGDIKLANSLLNNYFSINGSIKKGKQLGRTINFPTMNLKYNPKTIIPKEGVYYTNTLFKGKTFKSITNIGTNPTVDGNKLSIESYLLNFNEYIYDEYIKVFFIERIRDEIRFESLDKLKNQLEIDKIYAESQNIQIL
ncbi:MAG: bifunctional riboflavin kinase/FAD synthetase [Clostridiaceae bacterium]